MGHLIVISAPSGTGKTTIIKKLMAGMKGLVLSVSATTRSPRAGEKDGVDYIFTSEENFQKMIKTGDLLEWARVHSAFYGTPKEPVEKWLEKGRTILFDVDVQGGKNIKNKFKDAVLIFLLPPSKEELVKRLLGRATNKGKDLETRVKNADLEMGEKDFYDYQIVNDDLSKTVEEIKKIINASVK